MNYFDHAASSILYPEVLETLTKSFREDFANPSAQHELGHNLLEKILEIKEKFKKQIGAKAEDVLVFTSSATESNNTVIQGINFHENDVVLYSKADHPSVVVPVENLGKKSKATVKEIRLLEDGSIDVGHLKTLLNNAVKLVVLTHVNNQSGVAQEIIQLTALIKKLSPAHVHVDAVQSFGKLNLAVDHNVDSISFTSHKIGGPKGVAALYLKKDHNVSALLLGGGQEDGMRSSTQAFPLIVGFYKAAEISNQEKEAAYNQIINLNEKIKTELIKKIPNIQFPFKNTSPYILSFVIPRISSDIILRHLEMRKVYISSTSACSSKISGFNPSLLALNIPEKFHKNFLRISLGLRSTEKEVDELIKEFVATWNILERIR
jgi:cysteine desulfurase